MLLNRIKFNSGISILATIFLLLLAPAFSLHAQENKEAEDNEIQVQGKIISIDPTKGDVAVRLEFLPTGNFAKEDGTLARTIKFDTLSSNGKQEITFEKGKRMSPTEVLLNMYDGSVTDYPFDTHKADLVFFFTVKPDKTDKPADKPKSAEGETEANPETPQPVEEEMETEVPFTLDFTPTMAGYNFTTVKSKDSDETYIDLEITMSRAPMIKVFSGFIMALMWCVSLAVLGLVFTVVVKKRKAEIAMFSFIATLLFAFVTVRNSQPFVPPVGTFSDYLSFFWAEAILGLCLLSVILTWLFRKPA